MNRSDVTGESQDDREDGQYISTSDYRREMGKTSDDHNSTDHRGNRRGKSQFTDDRSIGRVNTDEDIAGGRRGNQMKEEKAQLNHSSDPD